MVAGQSCQGHTNSHNTHTHSQSRGEEEHDEGSAGVPLGCMEETRQQRLEISVACRVFDKNLFIVLKFKSVLKRKLECLTGFVLQCTSFKLSLFNFDVFISSKLQVKNEALYLLAFNLIL